MILSESYTIGAQGFVRQWSDENRWLISDETGAEYSEAIDPVEYPRTYHEGDVMPDDTQPEEADDEATVADFEQALADLGVRLV